MEKENLKPYQWRMLIEYKELKERIDRLRAFVFSTEVNNLSAKEQVAIDHQLSCMIDYKIVLLHRIHCQGLMPSDEEFDSLLNDIPTTAEFTKTILDDLTKRYDSCRSKYEHDQTAYEEGYCDALDYAMCKLDDFYDLFQPE